MDEGAKKLEDGGRFIETHKTLGTFKHVHTSMSSLSNVYQIDY